MSPARDGQRAPQNTNKTLAYEPLRGATSLLLSTSDGETSVVESPGLLTAGRRPWAKAVKLERDGQCSPAYACRALPAREGLGEGRHSAHGPPVGREGVETTTASRSANLCADQAEFIKCIHQLGPRGQPSDFEL